MLTSVSLRSSGSTSTSLEMFLTAPKLVNVTLVRYHFLLVLPWEQVRRLRKGRSSIAECLKALQQSPHLQKCQFEGVYSSYRHIFETIMPHDQLKDLHVALDHPLSMSLFDCITLPSLYNLNIQNNSSGSLPLFSVTSLFLRSACNLERLTIRSLFDDKDLILYLEAIPSLTYLHLQMIGDPWEVVGLTWHLVASLDPLSNPSRLLLPNLKYFRFKGQIFCEIRPIVDMLARRWHLSDDGGTSQNSSVSKLKLAEIFSTELYHLTADVQEELRNLSEEGMSIRIESC